MNNVDYMLCKLSKSKFRSSFHLRKYMIDYINDKGLDVIKAHTKDFINLKMTGNKRLLKIIRLLLLCTLVLVVVGLV